MGKYGTKSFLQAFCQNSEQLKSINYFNKKAPSLKFISYIRANYYLQIFLQTILSFLEDHRS